MNKETNIYSFADECYVFYGDYKKDIEERDKEIERLNNKIKEQNLLLIEFQDMEQRVEQLENIRKEAIEYVLKNKLYRFKYDDEELFEITTDKKAKDDLLNILNKGSDKE